MLENGDNDSNAVNVKNVKSKTMFDNKPNYFSLNNHPKVTNIFFDNKPNIYAKKKVKKKVKFVDEVYNKSLIEEIPIKSFKGYNVVYSQNGYSEFDRESAEKGLEGYQDTINILLVGRSTATMPIQELWTLKNYQRIKKNNLILMNV